MQFVIHLLIISPMLMYKVYFFYNAVNIYIKHRVRINTYFKKLKIRTNTYLKRELLSLYCKALIGTGKLKFPVEVIKKNNKRLYSP